MQSKLQSVKVRDFFLREKVLEFCHKFNLTKPVLTYANGSDGGNYLSEILRITIKSLYFGTEPPIENTIISKTPKEYSHRDQIVFFHELFKREIFMYTKLIPVLNKCQDHFNDYKQIKFPAVYLSGCQMKNEYIIMEDMKRHKFHMIADRYLNWEHIKIVLERLGRFHGLSYIFKNREELLFCELRKNCLFYCPGGLNQIYEKYWSIALDELHVRQYDQKYITSFENVTRTYFDIMKHSRKEEINDFDVICHGDVRTNNILFRYNERNQQPNDLCFLDWQMSHYGSPAIDLTFFLCTSVDQTLLDEKYYEIIDLYFSSLVNTTSEQMITPLLSKEELNSEMKKYFSQTIATCCTTLYYLFTADKNLFKDKICALIKFVVDKSLI